MTFAEKTDDMRRRRKLSLREFTRRLAEKGHSYSPSGVGNWMRDDFVPRVDVAAAIARVLNVSLDYLAFPEYKADDPAEKYPLQLPPPSPAPPRVTTKQVKETKPAKPPASRRPGKTG